MLVHEEFSSEWVNTELGLRQGCPLSPILFSLYITDLESRLLNSECGFKVTKNGDFWNVKEKKYFCIPGLLFADDLVLFGKNFKELEKLLKITTDFGNERGLVFNPLKSAVVIYSHHNVGDAYPLMVQGKEISTLEEYKYLGITLTNKSRILTKQEAIWEENATTALHQLQAQTVWGFNKFAMTSVQWKATAVPKLTFANAVVVMSRKSREKLEKAQRAAGKWALGVSGSKLANEFIEGELAWSSFEAREAQSKIRYFARVRNMPDHRWPKAMLNMMDLTDLKTEAYKRMDSLMKSFDCENITVEISPLGKPLLEKHGLAIKQAVRKAQENRWREGMLYKTSLRRYREQKICRGINEILYDNSRGSALLAMARAGMLPTTAHISSPVQGEDPFCIKCGMAPETLEHVIFDCNDIYHTEEELLQRLGLHEDHNPEAVYTTKRLLETWERETRRIR